MIIMSIRLVITVLVPVLLCGLATGQWRYDCRRMNDCQNGGTCSLEGQDCQCPTGFEGYNCQIKSVNRCTEQTCANGGVCYVKDGADVCACAFGYHGSTCESETVMVTCEGPTTKFELTFPDLFDGTVKLMDTNTSDACAFSNTTSNGLITYSLNVSIELNSSTILCGRDALEINEQDTDANYTGLIEVRYFDLVVASSDQLFKLTCQHIGDDKDISISKDITNIGVETEGNLTQVEKTKLYSPVEFEIVDMSGNPLPSIIYVGDSYKICFYLFDTSVYKKVFINSCSTNNTLESPNTKIYDIYSQGCPTKKGMRTTSIQEASNKTIDSIEHPTVCLPIRAFKFIDSNSLAISCKVKLCRENNTGCEIPTSENCTAIIDGTGTSTTIAPDTTANTTGTADISTIDNGSNAVNTTNNGSTTAAPDPNEGRRRRRAADDGVDTEEKTVTTVLNVYGQRDYTSGQSQGEPEASTVEECLSQIEITAVVSVLGSVVLVLFIACFILICIIMRRKSKNVFEPQTVPNQERFQIPRAHVNQAYREI